MAARILPRSRRPMIERFWAKVDKNGPIHPVLGTRCWLWTASKTSTGYGHISKPGAGKSRMVLAHRYVYGHYVGPIPDGLNLLHHCDNPPCVNYEDHLFPGTQADNLADCIAKGRTRAVEAMRLSHLNKTHCRNGHEYTLANTAITSGVGRVCRTCHLEQLLRRCRRLAALLGKT